MRLSQINYIGELLERFGFGDLNTKESPMVTEQVTNGEWKLQEEPMIEQSLEQTVSKAITPYGEAVGSLLHLANGTSAWSDSRRLEHDR